MSVRAAVLSAPGDLSVESFPDPALGPGGRPLDRLLERDFGAFEDALATLAERGFVLRSGGGGR